jgi:hypothetical protein
MFSVSFFGLFSSKLAMELMDSKIDAPIGILASFGNHEDFAVLSSGDYLHVDIAFTTAIDNYLNLVDAVVVPGQLGSLLFGVFFDSIRYANMFAGDCEKQYDSPSLHS